jgi:hypothetical protein
MANIDIQRSNGDLRYDANGDITLATRYQGGGPGLHQGNVYVLGNLIVQGTNTIVETSNITLADRIIVLNKGEIGPGVSLITSGLQIDRGNIIDPQTGTPTSRGIDATWLFDESRQWTYNGITTAGMWIGRIGASATGLVANAIRTYGNANLSLLGVENPNAVVTVEGTSNYNQHVTDENHIPNKKYVDLAIANQPDRSGLQLNNGYGTTPSTTTTIKIADLLTSVTPAATEEQIRFTVNTNQWITMFNNRLDLGSLRITSPNIITTKVDGTNIILTTVASSGSLVKPDVEIQAPVKMVIDANYGNANPLVSSGSIKMYAKNQGPGGSGIYFVNSQGVRDELPSKRRSFIASLVL